MSAVERCGPGFVFIGTKQWYALVSNVSARIECRSPETWSPRCSREILDTVLSAQCAEEVQVEGNQIKMN